SSSEYRPRITRLSFDVVTRTWVAIAFDLEQITVQRYGNVEISHLDGHTEKLRNGAHTSLLLLTEHDGSHAAMSSRMSNGSGSARSRPLRTRGPFRGRLRTRTLRRLHGGRRRSPPRSASPPCTWTPMPSRGGAGALRRSPAWCLLRSQRRVPTSICCCQW